MKSFIVYNSGILMVQTSHLVNQRMESISKPPDHFKVIVCAFTLSKYLCKFT